MKNLLLLEWKNNRILYLSGSLLMISEVIIFTILEIIFQGQFHKRSSVILNIMYFSLFFILFIAFFQSIYNETYAFLFMLTKKRFKIFLVKITLPFLVFVINLLIMIAYLNNFGIITSINYIIFLNCSLLFLFVFQKYIKKGIPYLQIVIIMTLFTCYVILSLYFFNLIEYNYIRYLWNTFADVFALYMSYLLFRKIEI